MDPRVRARALVERFRTSLFALPVLLIAALTVAAIATLWIDGRSGTPVPEPLRTTVASARTILGTIATGLVAGAALLFSSVLVAVQLAASQFSPRTPRAYLRDRGQQVVIGLVVGTAVFCLVVLVRTRSAFDESGAPLVPHLSVLAAVLLASASMLSIVAIVNRLAQSLQVERQLESVMQETIDIVRRRPERAPAHPDLPDAPAPGGDPVEVTAPVSGWIQQVSVPALGAVAPADGGVEVTRYVGEYVWEGSVIARLWPADPLDPDAAERVRGAFALGAQRTMQEDVGFGIVRLVDVALRALSPGVNDPNTAIDVIGRLGAVLVCCGEHADPPRSHEGTGGVVLTPTAPTFAGHVRAAVSPLRPLAASDLSVAVALAEMLVDLRTELRRRGDDAVTAVTTDEIAAFRDDVTAGPLSERDTDVFLATLGGAT